MSYVLLQDDPRSAKKVLFAETPSIFPGQSLDGEHVSYVEHFLSDAVFRTTVWIE
jgi:hypothetical protein